jgi:2-C-methyl-D-erythritol 4-phosphate cytidylyltransferase/2-C-methyl-D-erythritol 2,4-cyclodiphosphate synthase
MTVTYGNPIWTEPGLSFDSLIISNIMPASSTFFHGPEKSWAILLAAGQSRRFCAASHTPAKQFLLWQGVPLYWHSARAFSRSNCVAGIIFVFPADQLAAEESRLHSLHADEDLGLPWIATSGGASRQESVQQGLAALPPHIRWVFVHDAARPFVSPALIRRVQDGLAAGAPGVIPVIPVTDTVKEISGDCVVATLPRHTLAAAQTPQGFVCPLLCEAYASADPANPALTDDASLLEQQGHRVCTVAGEMENIKITHHNDMIFLQEQQIQREYCTGMGYDVHRFGTGRPMKLGGISIAGAPEIIAHSDGDVLLHALTDAVLACACLGDIGQHFSDRDPQFEGISSAILLDQALHMAAQSGIRICHADLTVVAQKPKIAPWRAAIRKNIARLLALPATSVNLKATTEEGLGYTGRSEGIKAYAIVTAVKQPHSPCC